MMERSSAFSKPEWSSRDQVHNDPPLYHVGAYLTGGLQAVFNHIRAGTQVAQQTRKLKQRDQFRPFDGQILARRYRLTDKLSTQGQFAVIVGAKDVFCEDRPVIIKVMHKSFYSVGLQERHCLWRLAVADPRNLSHTVNLLNTFKFDGHCCLVFEFLHPTPITGVFEEYNLPNGQLIDKIRTVAFQLLQVLSFLQQQNTIHADIKPENILLQDVHNVRSLKVIDFGNAIHHIHKEVSLYYCDFELQTLQYRAPEVIFGIPFGTEVDMWSLGCVLAELYLGESLFGGVTKEELLHSMTKLLGRFPVNVFHRGKFFEKYQSVTSKIPQPDTTIRVMQCLRQSRNYAFANFLAELLRYNPDERLTPTQALRHSFLAPEFSLGYFIPSAHSLPNCMDINPRSYPFCPRVPAELKRQNPSTFDLLKMGTRFSESDKAPSNKIAKVCPFELNTSEVQSPKAVESSSVPPHSHTDVSTQPGVSDQHVTVEDVEQTDNLNKPLGTDSLVVSAENQIILQPDDRLDSSELNNLEAVNSGSNICVNSAKLQNIMAMIAVEQERVEDLMDVEVKRDRTDYNAGVKRNRANRVTTKRRRRKPDVDSTNFLCDYASSSSDSEMGDCTIMEEPAQEERLQQHDCLSNSLLPSDMNAKPSRETEFTNKVRSESMPVNIGEIPPSQMVNHSTKSTVPKANSNQIQSRLDDALKVGSKDPVFPFRPKRPAKRKLLFSKAFPVAKPDNQARSIKGLKLWNEKYRITQKRRMKRNSNWPSPCYKDDVSKLAGDDPFEFKMTPLKSPEAKHKVAITEEKKPLRSRKKSLNTVFKHNKNVKHQNVKDKSNSRSNGADRSLESLGPPITSVENLDRVFNQYSNMKGISPITSTPVQVCSSGSRTKRRCLFSESVTEPADSPCKRKYVQIDDTSLDGARKQSELESLKSAKLKAKRLRTIPNSNAKSERLNVNEIMQTHLGGKTRLCSPSNQKSLSEKTKIVHQKIVGVEESFNSTLIKEHITKVQSPATRSKRRHLLQPVKIGITELVTKLVDRQSNTPCNIEENIGKVDRTLCDRTPREPDDDDDIILLDI